jgi:hypothetical protein
MGKIRGNRGECNALIQYPTGDECYDCYEMSVSIVTIIGRQNSSRLGVER